MRISEIGQEQARRTWRRPQQARLWDHSNYFDVFKSAEMEGCYRRALAYSERRSL